MAGDAHPVRSARTDSRKIQTDIAYYFSTQRGSVEGAEPVSKLKAFATGHDPRVAELVAPASVFVVVGETAWRSGLNSNPQYRLSIL
jgi:hypothetical protein